VPIDIVGEVASELVKGAGEEAVDRIHRRWGWKGCLATTLIIAAIAAVLFYLF
jgi:hypothetical protein